MVNMRQMLKGFLLIPALLEWIIFRLVRKIFMIIQAVIWRINGTQQGLEAAKLPENYKQSAQVMDIKWKCGFDLTLQAFLPNYITTHARFVHPDHVLQDHVDLYFTTGEVAVFAEARPGVQTWRSHRGSFAYESMYRHAVRLVIMPLSSLHRLSARLGPPSARLCFLFNTGRCGSTLFSQMFECTEECVSLSEPQPFGLFDMKAQKAGNPAELERTTKSIINVLCKPVTSPKRVTSYVIKFPSQQIVSFDLVYRCFPDAKYLFMYRDVISVSKSFYKMIKVLPLTIVLENLFHLPVIGEKISEGMMKDFGFEMPGGFQHQNHVPIAAQSVMWCLSVAAYIRLRHAGARIQCFRYEDLAADPVGMFRAILGYCGLDPSLALPAARALRQDSQEVSRFGASRHVPVAPVTPGVEAAVNHVLASFNLPLLGEDDRLDGILSADSVNNNKA